MGKWLGAVLVLAFYVWVIRGGIKLQRILDNPRDARNMRDRKPEGFKWSDEEGE